VPVIAPTAPAPRPRRPSMWRGLLIALIVFIVLGAATVFVLHTLGLLRSDSAADNQDLVRPE